MAALSEKVGVTQIGSGRVNIDGSPGESLDRATTPSALLINKLMVTDMTSNNSIR